MKNENDREIKNNRNKRKKMPSYENLHQLERQLINASDDQIIILDQMIQESKMKRNLILQSFDVPKLLQIKQTVDGEIKLIFDKDKNDKAKNQMSLEEKINFIEWIRFTDFFLFELLLNSFKKENRKGISDNKKFGSL